MELEALADLANTKERLFTRAVAFMRVVYDDVRKHPDFIRNEFIKSIEDYFLDLATFKRDWETADVMIKAMRERHHNEAE